jgi:hypothetical protein
MMPSKTKKQRKTMQAAAHNPHFAKRVGIPQAIAREFNAADTRRKVARRSSRGR